MRQLLLLALLTVTACTTTGQHFDIGTDKDDVATVLPGLKLVRLSANTVAATARLKPQRVIANTELEQQLRDYEYRVGQRDVLIFTVWDHPELTIPAGEFRSPEIQGHLVSATGDIFFPYVGPVNVAGRTLIDIRQELTNRLSKYIASPQLDVRIAAFRSKRINVTGRVVQPGTFAITDTPMTLVDAIDLAGGASEQGALQRVQVLRGEQLHSLDLMRLLHEGDMRQNMLLIDGDIVFVPDNSDSVVHVFGSVAKPGAIAMTSGNLNLAEAISHSGGFDTSSADARRVLVFRNETGGPVAYWLDARSPDAMLLATQFALSQQDVVFVASTTLARWNRVVNLILPTIQSLWQTQSLIDRLND